MNRLLQLASTLKTALRSGKLDDPAFVAQTCGFETKGITSTQARSGEWVLIAIWATGFSGKAGLMHMRVPSPSLIFFFPDEDLPPFRETEMSFGPDPELVHAKNGQGFIARYKKDDAIYEFAVYQSHMNCKSLEVFLAENP